MRIELGNEIDKIIHETCVSINGVSINGQWLEILRLHIKPKPKWMPKWIYSRLVSLVFQQSREWLA